MKYMEILEKLDGLKPRSAWEKGVLAYTYDLAENVFDCIKCIYFDPFEVDIDSYTVAKYCYSGAQTATEYSYGGCALIYDEDIAYNLCTPSELKRTYYGRRPPNSNESWLDVQARAIKQAVTLLINIVEGRIK